MEANNPKIDWRTARERLKKEYPQLTEADLMYEADKEEEWLEHLQAKVNKSKQEIRHWLALMG